jgi:hypothetical protein
MALRRNPQRGCQERLLPPIATIKIQSTNAALRETFNNTRENRTVYQRNRRRQAIDTQTRRGKNLTRQVHRPASDKPFPFFKLPREIRDQVYSYLVVRPSGSRPIIAAAPLLSDRKKRVAAQAKRLRLDRKRVLSGKPPVRTRHTESQPIVHLNLLQSSQRLHDETKDCLYSNNWFAITLDKLPLTTFEVPYGWDLSRITKLVVELQVKDVAHMNSYVDWTALFSSFTSLRFLHIIPTLHPRYYDWAHPELSNWTTMHFVHKAFFRELLAAIPSHTDLRLGSSPDATSEMPLQGKSLSRSLVRDMYVELSPGRLPQPRLLTVDRVVDWR